MRISGHAAVRRSSSPSRVAACCTSTSIASSGACLERSGCGSPAIIAGHACTTSGTASPSGRCSIGDGRRRHEAACNVATLIERYFTDRLMRQCNVSPNTIASYRDTFRLLFMFAQARLRKSPSDLALGDLDAPFIGAFLIDLETKRGASAKTRNLRLTAIRSFFRFVSFEEPAHSALIQRVLAIPSKPTTSDRCTS